MKKFILLGLVIIFTALLIGCNTMQGLGKDLQSLGRTIEDTAE